MKTVVYFTTKATPKVMAKIREHFGMPDRMNINRETEAEIKPDQVEELRETE